MAWRAAKKKVVRRSLMLGSGVRCRPSGGPVQSPGKGRRAGEGPAVSGTLRVKAVTVISRGCGEATLQFPLRHHNVHIVARPSVPSDIRASRSPPPSRPLSSQRQPGVRLPPAWLTSNSANPNTAPSSSSPSSYTVYIAKLQKYPVLLVGFRISIPSSCRG